MKKIEFKYGNNITKYALQDAMDENYKDLIMGKIMAILTDDEGNFKIKSFSMEIEKDIINFFSDMKSKSQAVDNLNKKRLWRI